MRKYNCDKYETVSIIGSFNKHYETICDVANLFKQNGIQVLAPDISKIVSNKDGFAVLKTNEISDAVLIEREFLEKCLKSDFIYVCNKNGYLGKTVMMELGYFLGKGQEVFFMETPNEEKILLEMTKKAPIVYSPEELINMLTIHNKLPDDLFDSYDKRIADFNLER